MLEKEVELMAAPVGMQPSRYVTQAYEGHVEAQTARARLRIENRRGWSIRVSWLSPQPITDAGDEPGVFVDACALLTAETEDAQWITMGAPGAAVSGVLWRADSDRPLAVRAEGLGTVVRSDPPLTWNVIPTHAAGKWDVTFELSAWPALDRSRKLALAVWQGAHNERAGIKSVTTGWLDVAL